MEKRQILALTIGVLTGYLLGKWFGLDVYPFFSVPHGELWWGRILPIFGLGIMAGTVAPLISWKHTPGLPGMVFSLTIAGLGISAAARHGNVIGQPDEIWILSTAESLLILTGFWLTYMLAWIIDTQVVFRSLSVKPRPKQICPTLMLIRLMPCSLFTAVGGVMIGFAVPLPGVISIPLSFALISFLASYLLKVSSTLWYAASVPSYLALVGVIVLSNPTLAKFAMSSSWQQINSFIICGLGSAGAIFGHWLWVMGGYKESEIY